MSPYQARDMTRRIKLLTVPMRWLVTCMFVDKSGGPGNETVEFWRARLPEGAAVVGHAIIDPRSKCVFVPISHPSFPEVRDGEEPPRIDADWRLESRLLATEEEIEARRKRPEAVMDDVGLGPDAAKPALPTEDDLRFV